MERDRPSPCEPGAGTGVMSELHSPLSVCIPSDETPGKPLQRLNCAESLLATVSDVLRGGSVELRGASPAASQELLCP